jgi:hypothetical protein
MNDKSVLPVSSPGFSRQKIEVILPSFFKGAGLMVNGKPVPKNIQQGVYLLTNDKGQSVRARFRNTAFGLDYPDLLIGDQPVSLFEPLKWYFWVWVVLPLLLVFVGGALGAVIGVAAVWINVRLLRGSWHWLARLGATLGVTLLAAGIWWFLHLRLTGAL